MGTEVMGQAKGYVLKWGGGNTGPAFFGISSTLCFWWRVTICVKAAVTLTLSNKTLHGGQSGSRWKRAREDKYSQQEWA